ncbi:MAG: lysophospholipid acyltransferase family protein [Acidimicrobiales bacterium]
MIGADTPSARRWNEGRPSLFSRFAYDVVRNVFSIALRVWVRLEVHGAERIPLTGPVILAPVHRSNLDAPVVAALTGRRSRFMGKEALWKHPRLGRLWSAMGAIPVLRGSVDREALRACETVLSIGQPLVMFPEGTRREGALIENLFDGPAFLAARTGAPILPIGIGGSSHAMGRGAKWVRPTKVVALIGEPIPAPGPTEGGRASRRAVRDLTARLERELQALYDEAQARAGQ